MILPVINIVSCLAFTKLDFMRLWKGLFYCMWMSDKPLIQEELAESLSKLVHCFNSKDVVFLYTTCALETLGTEWIGIDQYRLDKFSMVNITVYILFDKLLMLSYIKIFFISKAG